MKKNSKKIYNCNGFPLVTEGDMYYNCVTPLTFTEINKAIEFLKENNKYDAPRPNINSQLDSK